MHTDQHEELGHEGQLMWGVTDKEKKNIVLRAILIHQILVSTVRDYRINVSNHISFGHTEKKRNDEGIFQFSLCSSQRCRCVPALISVSSTCLLLYST